MSLRAPYPPCASSDGYCDTGYKATWPNTLGMDGEQAKAIIEKDNPLVTVLIRAPNNYVIHNFCCNRVWVFVDEHYKVLVIPKIFLLGTTDKGLQRIFKQVEAWKFDLSDEEPEIFVLSKGNNWIKLLKPRIVLFGVDEQEQGNNHVYSRELAQELGLYGEWL
ncbi:unnamed protein product [Fraxinus pennsylvanica]|uniref:RFTS domain-containing protein n=1 Tax=Fraxinus pennsylvanica TaxID=56036 RepID=A0AAD2EFV9_9LAMI|nr:unnamed protein product [Fraxinus pennsylvanica]